MTPPALLLHGGGLDLGSGGPATTWGLLVHGWELHPSVVAGSLLLLAGYLAAERFRWRPRTAWLAAGIAVMFVALTSPLDPLGDDYLFSAHMLQHLLLMLAVPPLLLAGFDPALARRWLGRNWVRRTERILGRPVVAWFLGIGTLWLWHVPYFYNLTLASEPVHIFEHLSFLVTGTVFWWPVLAPVPECRLSAPAAVFYLFAGAVANTVLGVLLTFAPLGYYPAYQHPEDELGVLELIREGWGIDPKSDLQLGGLFMWMLGGFVFLGEIVAALARWYREPDPPEAPLPVLHPGEERP